MKFHRTVRNHHLHKYKSVRITGKVNAVKLTSVSNDGRYEVKSRTVNIKIGAIYILYIYIYIYICVCVCVCVCYNLYIIPPFSKHN